MNSAQLKQATLKAIGLRRKLRRHFDLTQSVITPSLLTWFEVIGYTVLLEPDIALGKYRIGRSSYSDVILRDRLHSALQKINPTKPDEAIAADIYQITYTESSDLLANNRRFHKLLTNGVEVEYILNEEIVHDKVLLIDQFNLLNNDWLVIHPLTVVEGNHVHCPDVVVFINGLPLAVILSIQPSDEQATFKESKERIQTYFQQIPKLFFYNTLLVITCQNQARVGTLTSDWQEFSPWHTIDGEAVAVDALIGISKLPLASARNERHPKGEDFLPLGATELEVLIQGIFDKRRFLEQILHFIVFEANPTSISKKLLRRPFCTIPNCNKKFRSPPTCGSS
jgi:type I site-specific restriction-modification system R (restriction) subunit